jgi:hypothetical protein
MNRSALNAEVEHYLRTQERERALARARHDHEVPEMEDKQFGLLSRLLAALKSNRNRQPELEWKRRPGRSQTDSG